jgi:hypothetical protein
MSIPTITTDSPRVATLRACLRAGCDLWPLERRAELLRDRLAAHAYASDRAQRAAAERLRLTVDEVQRRREQLLFLRAACAALLAADAAA